MGYTAPRMLCRMALSSCAGKTSVPWYINLTSKETMSVSTCPDAARILRPAKAKTREMRHGAWPNLMRLNWPQKTKHLSSFFFVLQYGVALNTRLAFTKYLGWYVALDFESSSRA